MWTGDITNREYWYVYKLGHSAPGEKEFECVTCKRFTGYALMGLTALGGVVIVTKPGFIRWGAVASSCLSSVGAGVCFRAAHEAQKQNEFKRLRILRREKEAEAKGEPK